MSGSVGVIGEGVFAEVEGAGRTEVVFFLVFFVDERGLRGGEAR